MVKTHITLTRKAAAIKLESATSATWFYQRARGSRYQRPIEVQEVVRLFKRDPRARMRIRLEDSEHTISIVRNAEEETGYSIMF